jgi:hypothetical protein
MRLFSRVVRVAASTLIVAPSVMAGGTQRSAAEAVPAGFFQYSTAQLKQYETSLGSRLNQYKQAAEQVGDFGNHTAWIAHREADGLAEIHQAWSDLMFVVSGEASLQLGGEIESPYVESPGEVRGPRARGASVRIVRAGDVVNVPAGVQHRFLVPAGQQITFFTMKIAKAR